MRKCVSVLESGLICVCAWSTKVCISHLRISYELYATDSISMWVSGRYKVRTWIYMWIGRLVSQSNSVNHFWISASAMEANQWTDIYKIPIKRCLSYQPSNCASNKAVLIAWWIHLHWFTKSLEYWNLPKYISVMSSCLNLYNACTKNRSFHVEFMSETCCNKWFRKCYS